MDLFVVGVVLIFSFIFFLFGRVVCSRTGIPRTLGILFQYVLSLLFVLNVVSLYCRHLEVAQCLKNAFQTRSLEYNFIVPLAWLTQLSVVVSKKGALSPHLVPAILVLVPYLFVLILY